MTILTWLIHEYIVYGFITIDLALMILKIAYTHTHRQTQIQTCLYLLFTFADACIGCSAIDIFLTKWLHRQTNIILLYVHVYIHVYLYI